MPEIIFIQQASVEFSARAMIRAKYRVGPATQTGKHIHCFNQQFGVGSHKVPGTTYIRLNQSGRAALKPGTRTADTGRWHCLLCICRVALFSELFGHSPVFTWRSPPRFPSGYNKVGFVWLLRILTGLSHSHPDCSVQEL